ncbi:hypothetical protein TL16_g09879 [Triparma laevis f. inornata]|uniref:Uncharacterized protein n=1 Tax=Triparma laevis f. inornata TaxID=1714386 RepID=A0A9W7BCK7_9STRA|nr:hypothetical protein TL16_g09879 [Triparma laevis f. inornata]
MSKKKLCTDADSDDSNSDDSDSDDSNSDDSDSDDSDSDDPANSTAKPTSKSATKPTSKSATKPTSKSATKPTASSRQQSLTTLSPPGSLNLSTLFSTPDSPNSTRLETSSNKRIVKRSPLSQMNENI